MKSRSTTGAKDNRHNSSKRLDLKVNIIERMSLEVEERVAKVDETRKWIYQPTVDFIKKANAAFEHPDTVVWHNFNLPAELIYAMDLIPFNYEFISLICAPFFQDYFCDYVDKSHEEAIPSHLCSYTKGTLGMMVSDILPEPKAFIFSSQPCDNGLAANQAVADYYGVESFCLDTPYERGDTAIEYMKGEVKGAFEYLEHMTGKKLDIDRYREVMEVSHRAHELLWEINELKKKKPCPIPSAVILRQTALAMYTMTGSPETVTFLERHLADAKDRARRGVGTESGFEEKCRTAWLYAFISFDYSLYDWLEEKFGHIPVVFQAAQYYYMPKDISSLDNLHRALGDRTLECAMGRQNRGHLDEYVQDCVHWCQDWNCDAAIFAGHVACKSGWAVAQIIKEALLDIGVPTLVYECDALDPRVVTPEEIREKLATFHEMIA